MNEKESVLRRMVRPARPGGLVAPDPVFDALRIAIPRLADDLLGLEVCLDAMTSAAVERDRIEFGEGALIFQMLHDRCASGLVIVSGGLLAGLVEVQVTGRISASPVKDRPATQTDAVVTAPLIDAWIGAMQTGEGAHPGIAGFRRGARLADQKSAKLTLDNVAFKSLDFTLSLGGGVRVATLNFILPQRETVQERARKSFDPGDIEMAFDVVLARMRRSYREVRGWQEGIVIELDKSALEGATLEHRGRKLTAVRLGRIGNLRAIKVAVPKGDGSKPNGETGQSKASVPLPAPDEDPVVADLSGMVGGQAVAPIVSDAAAEVVVEPGDGAEGAFDLPPLAALPDLEELEPIEEVPAVAS